MDVEIRGGVASWHAETDEVSVLPFPEGESWNLYHTEWSPDGNNLLLMMSGGNPNQVAVMDPAGERPLKILTREASSNMTWCSANTILVQMVGNRDYAKIDVETGASTPLLGQRAKGWMFRPRCSPDGSTVVFDYNHRDGPGLWLVGVEEDDERLLLPKEGLGSFVPLLWSQDGQWIYYTNTAEFPRQIWRISSRGGAPEEVVRIPANSYLVAMSRNESTIGVIERLLTMDLWLWRQPGTVTAGEPIGDSTRSEGTL
jgi:Tol biopolymer transport system component